MIWMRGESEVSIVNTLEFSARHINNFWNYKGVDARAIAAAIDADATRLVGIGFLPGSNETQTIHVYDGGDGVSIFEGYDVLPEVEAWLCCEVSSDGEVFFLGGSQYRNFMNGDAYLCAMTFDEEAEMINYARYGKDTAFHCINSLKRHPDGNILFAGCNGYVAVILWAQDQFHLINAIPNVINSPITDMSFSMDTLYVVSDHDKGMVIYFTDDYMDRDPAGPEPPHGRYHNLPKNPSQLSLADQYRSRPRMPPKYGHLFRDYDIQQIQLPGVENMRIEVTPDERFIYVGRNVLKVLELENGQYKLLDNADHIRPFIDLKLLGTGEVLTFDEATSDLVKYDPSLNEIKRLNGQRQIFLGNFSILFQHPNFNRGK